MVPRLLAKAGYEADPTAAGKDRAVTIPYGIIPLLVSLRQDGRAPELDKICDDARQTSAARLVSIMALYGANEELRVPALLEILRQEQFLERRLLAILCLMHAKDRNAGAKLVDLLDDPNCEVKIAVVCGLRGPLPPQALPKLKRILDGADPPAVIQFALDTVAKYNSQDACEILAGFLSAALEDQQKRPHLDAALHAFQTATGQHWTGAGANGDAYYRTAARRAIEWWKNEGRRTWEPR
jgi:hypothetical protein